MNIEMRQAPKPGRLQPMPGPRRIAELEVLRTVAILMVLAAHLPINLMFWPSKYTGFLFHLGNWAGVDLFFAVSGFVIARGLLPQLENVNMQEFLQVAIMFWIRRAWRLWPSAWFWLLAPLVLCLVFNRSGAYQSFFINWLMAMAGFANVANFFMLHASDKGGHGVAFAQWSLSLEEQFYILLPFAALLFRRHLPHFMGLLLVLAFFLPTWPILVVTRAGAIAAGVLLAIASRHPGYALCAPVFLAQSRVFRIFLLVGCVAMLTSFGDQSWMIVPFFLGPIAIVSGILVWAASYGEGYLWAPGWSRKLMEIVAARSYAIYLVHIPIFFGMHEVWFRLYCLAVPTHRQAAVYFAVAALLVAAVAELNYRLLERPLREHGRQVAIRFARHRLEIMP